MEHLPYEERLKRLGSSVLKEKTGGWWFITEVYTIVEAVTKLSAELLFIKSCSTGRNCSMKLAGGQFKPVKSN